MIFFQWAIEQELRKINAEQKRNMKAHIRTFKAKLEVDAQDMVFRERDAQKAKEALRFVAARKRR